VCVFVLFFIYIIILFVGGVGIMVFRRMH